LTRKWKETFRVPFRGVRGEGFDDIGPDGKVVLEEQTIEMRSLTKGHVMKLSCNRVTTDARGRV